MGPVVSAFPKPFCPTCATQTLCQEAGEVRGDYPACRSPMRHDNVESAARLFTWWQRFHGVTDDRLDSVRRTLLARLARDREFSELFEPSLSHDVHGWHALRFSYAFPGLRRDEVGCLATLRELMAAFGEAALGHVERLAIALHDPCVEQVLFGLAYDTPAQWRVKLYLQFRSDAGVAGLRLARAMVGSDDLAAVAQQAPLHLCGLDLGAVGLVGAKLYFLHRELRPAEARAWLGDTLASWGERRWHNLLRIHRLRGPGGEGLAQPTAVDFHLAENDLLPTDVESLLAGEDAPYWRLKAEFPLALRRLSLAIGGGKVNGYYVLTD
jgi:hypothetical protein